MRNAVDHGIESPADRAAAGKARTAVITVSASLKGAQVEIAIDDDGRGLDRQRIREAARARGMAESTDDRDLLALVFHPGFSTARALTGAERDAAHGTMRSTPTSVRTSTASSPRSPLGRACTTVIAGSGRGS